VVLAVERFFTEPAIPVLADASGFQGVGGQQGRASRPARRDPGAVAVKSKLL
jgi:hypothetical protein